MPWIHFKPRRKLIFIQSSNFINPLYIYKYQIQINVTRNDLPQEHVNTENNASHPDELYTIATTFWKEDNFKLMMFLMTHQVLVHTIISADNIKQINFVWPNIKAYFPLNWFSTKLQYKSNWKKFIVAAKTTSLTSEI